MLGIKRTTIIFVVGCWSLSCLVFAQTQKVEMNALYEEKSLYHDVYVVGNENLQCIGFQSKKAIKLMGCQTKATPDIIFNVYNRLLLAGLYINPHPQKILMIGLGVGALPRAFSKLYPNAQIDVVEIDPVVVKLAKRFFGYSEGNNVHTFVEDGRVNVKNAIKQGKKYDMVILDAYNAEYIPEHLMTKEFFEEIKKILVPDGVVAANTFSASGLYPNESATYEAVFGPFYNLKEGNRIIIAQNGKLLPPEQVLANAVSLDKKLEQFGVTRDWLYAHFTTDRDWPSDAVILTDQYSPSNLLNEKPLKQ